MKMFMGNVMLLKVSCQQFGPNKAEYRIFKFVWRQFLEDYYNTTDDRMPAVTIYKNNQLGISINVEEPEEEEVSTFDIKYVLCDKVLLHYY